MNRVCFIIVVGEPKTRDPWRQCVISCVARKLSGERASKHCHLWVSSLLTHVLALASWLMLLTRLEPPRSLLVRVYHVTIRNQKSRISLPEFREAHIVIRVFGDRLRSRLVSLPSSMEHNLIPQILDYQVLCLPSSWNRNMQTTIDAAMRSDASLFDARSCLQARIIQQND